MKSSYTMRIAEVPYFLEYKGVLNAEESLRLFKQARSGDAYERVKVVIELFEDKGVGMVYNVKSDSYTVVLPEDNTGDFSGPPGPSSNNGCKSIW